MTFKTLSATLRKNLLIQIRAYPIDFFLGSLLTCFYTSLSAWLTYNILFKGSLSADFYELSGTGDYMGYVIIGGLSFLFTVRTCLNVSRSLMNELWEGTLESLMLAPFRRAEYFGGNMLVQTLTTSMETFISVLIAIPFGLSLAHTNFISFIAVFFASLIGFFGLSMLLGVVMLYTRDTYISQNTLFAVIALVCGISFPVEFLPKALQLLSALIPVTEIVRLYRASLLRGEALSGLWGGILYVVMLGLVYSLSGFWLMKKAEIIALERMEG